MKNNMPRYRLQIIEESCVYDEVPCFDSFRSALEYCANELQQPPDALRGFRVFRNVAWKATIDITGQITENPRYRDLAPNGLVEESSPTTIYEILKGYEEDDRRVRAQPPMAPAAQESP